MVKSMAIASYRDEPMREELIRRCQGLALASLGYP